MSARNECRPFDPDDPEQIDCLQKAKCYVDRTVNPPVVCPIESKDDYEIIGWVWLLPNGQLKSYGVDVVKGEGLYFIYNNMRYPPGVYYLIRKGGREFLVSESFLKSI